MAKIKRDELLEKLKSNYKKASTKMLTDYTSDIIRDLERVKPLYKILDALVIELTRRKIKKFSAGGFNWQVRDNFKDKNTAFKATGIRRFEIVEDKRRKEKV
jgi:hypothetical protein